MAEHHAGLGDDATVVLDAPVAREIAAQTHAMPNIRLIWRQ
jgi:hypothetical protein